VKGLAILDSNRSEACGCARPGSRNEARRATTPPYRLDDVATIPSSLVLVFKRGCCTAPTDHTLLPEDWARRLAPGLPAPCDGSWGQTQ